jgi:hypothetical protein
MKDARYWIERLGLQRHPEGGYYRETYRAREGIAGEHLPARFGGDRPFSTAIYFLLPGGEISVLHRIKQDEVWHFHEGSALVIHVIDPQGECSEIRLGPDPDRGETLQAVLPAGRLFGAFVSDARLYALVGCTVAPGFDFADLEIPTRGELLWRFPRHRAIIERLTR